jgi:hypothetical protein
MLRNDWFLAIKAREPTTLVSRGSLAWRRAVTNRDPISTCVPISSSERFFMYDMEIVLDRAFDAVHADALGD